MRHALTGSPQGTRAGLRIAILVLLLSRAVEASTTPPQVDVYLNMESGGLNSLVTTNLLNAATYGHAGYWSLSPDMLSAMRISTDYDQPLGSVTVGGTTYTDNGSRTIAFKNSTDQEYARYTFDEPHAKVSMGCFFRVGNFTGSTFGSYDVIALEGDDDFQVLNFQDFPGTEFLWEVHTQAGVGGPVRIQANKSYWVTMLWDQNNHEATLRVYDPVNWQLVGTSMLGLEDQPCRTVCFGRYDAHGVTSPNSHYYDDLIIDVTTARFPLLPGPAMAPRAPLTLLTDGAGTVTGATNNAPLEIGRAYKLTAKPAAGNLFFGWSGSTSSMAATLSFVMASNYTLTATFVTNLFPYLKGTYNGVFYDAGDTEQFSSGYVTVSVSSSGGYSGKVIQNGKTYRLHGAFAPDGTAVQIVPRTGTNALRVTLALDLNLQSDEISGTIAEEGSTGTVWSTPLTLDRNIYSRVNPAPSAGPYTISIPPDPGSNGPQGDGVGSMTVSSSGGVIFKGTLTDGTKVSQGTTLSKGGLWPFYLALYKGQGAIICPALLNTNPPTTDLTGTLAWFKQAQVQGRYCPGGFTNFTTLLGCRYRMPAGTNAVLNLSEGTLGFTNNQLSVDFANEVQLTPPSTIVNRSTNHLTFKVSKSTGLFNGSVTPPAGGKALPFSGALLQKRTMGAGFFLGTNQSGMVILAP
jgi:hypothetical protein